jgi:hypothetical protein
MEKDEILDQLESILKKKKLSKKNKLALEEAAKKVKKANTWKQWLDVIDILAKLLL